MLLEKILLIVVTLVLPTRAFPLCLLTTVRTVFDLWITSLLEQKHPFMHVLVIPVLHEGIDGLSHKGFRRRMYKDCCE